ncbi:hypothetical protein HNP33_003042 [Comamonas odontotermitis]|uniref:Lipoprotein n=1 Tax=Comamonas odontotermitis TaxID=379895 RepID=A0ABR6RIE9_9BURK|nr:hypothetical protein [Comamonas odontotermitis]
MKAAFLILASAVTLTACGSWKHPQYTGEAGRAQFERDKHECQQSARAGTKNNQQAQESTRPTMYSVHSQDMGGGYSSVTVTPQSNGSAPSVSKYDSGAQNTAAFASRDACLRARGWSFSTGG